MDHTFVPGCEAALRTIANGLQAMGFITAPTTPEEFDKIVRADIETFRRVGAQVGLIAK